MLEMLFAVMIICLLFFGMFQVGQLLVASEIIQHASARAARARTVGFNLWMCQKSFMVAAIPNSGRMITPDDTFVNTQLQDLIDTGTPGEVWDAALDLHPASQKVALELARIPFFLGSRTSQRGYDLLDYEEWSSLDATGLRGVVLQDTLTVEAEQKFPLLIDMKHWLYAPAGDDQQKTRVTLRGEHTIENHYSLYLEDLNW